MTMRLIFNLLNLILFFEKRKIVLNRNCLPTVVRSSQVT